MKKLRAKRTAYIGSGLTTIVFMKGAELEIEMDDFEIIDTDSEQECEHPSVNCPGDISTLRCDECGKSMVSPQPIYFT